MRLTKSTHRLLGILTLLCWVLLLFQIPVHAEQVQAYETVDGTDVVSVRVLLSDRSSSRYEKDFSKVCYPSIPYLYDTELTLTTQTGKSYIETAKTVDSYDRYFDFFVPLTEWQGTITLTASTDISAFCPQLSAETVNAYGFEFKDSHSSVIKLDTASFRQKTAPADNEAGFSYIPGSYTLSLEGTTAGAGICSAYIADLDYSEFGLTNNAIYETRGTATPNIITDVEFRTKDGTVIYNSYPSKDGIIYFAVPMRWDTTTESYMCTEDITMYITGIDRNFPDTVMSYTGYCNLGVCEYTPFTATVQNYILYRDLNVDYTDIEGDEPTPTDDEGNPVLDEIITTVQGGYSSALRFAVNSTLSDYRTDLVPTLDNRVSVQGAVTERFLAEHDRMSLSIGANATWGIFSLDNTVAQVSVDAGKYKLTASDLINLTYEGSLKAKKDEINDITLNATPAYTLKVKALNNSSIDYEIQGTTYTSTTQDNFVLYPDTEYLVKDHTSGNTYRAFATKADPHITIELGSNKNIVTDNTPTHEDVPNTADPISSVLLTLGIILAVFITAFVIVFIMNKKAEGRR